MKKIVLGIQVDNRFDNVSQVQNLLTKHGCIIKTRLGLHQQKEYDQDCTEKGLIILELVNNCGDRCKELEEELSKLDNIIVRKMEF
ncbi:hypothetical protein [Clostridiisalibacter paucivorans]|uniref:hypothetical protein n=1 Tax=Clostridiisalibacter paucivorans TaxID=408753 RepID=UPI00047AAEBB|nr:hypothetical protein [Clostridiisalibacter paucivorans]